MATFFTGTTIGCNGYLFWMDRFGITCKDTFHLKEGQRKMGDTKYPNLSDEYRT
jgi:hypothetical protein